MRETHIGREVGRDSVDRRDRLRQAVASAAAGGLAVCRDPIIVGQNVSPTAEAEKELQVAADRIKTVSRAGCGRFGPTGFRRSAMPLFSS